VGWTEQSANERTKADGLEKPQKKKIKAKKIRLEKKDIERRILK